MRKTVGACSMKTVETLHELISDSRIDQEYSVREYIDFCNGNQELLGRSWCILTNNKVP